MLDLTLKQLFGENAIQDSQKLTILKSDLPLLTASGNNRGEQLLVAILLQAHRYFEGVITDEQNRVITDEKGTAVKFDNKELYRKLNIGYWRKQYTQSVILDTFILDVFITPPPPNTSIDIDVL